MPGKYTWTPPRRSTDDPNQPPLPGMPEAKAPRIHPGHPDYYRKNHSSELWGHLAHPDLQEHNPFTNDIGDDHDYAKGNLWRQESGGYADRYEDSMDEPEGSPDRIERHLQRSIDKSLPAIAISAHAMHKVLDSGRMKTQFETHSSGGALNPESRRAVEHRFFGYPHDLPDHARPIYGYLTHDPSIQHPSARSYGEHALILHRPRIWHRTSAYIGDTLDNQHEGHSAHPVQDFRLSGFPRHSDPGAWRLDRYDPYAPYTEAHYHGGVGLRDVHYAVLHRPEKWRTDLDPDRTQEHEALKQKLNDHKIPWVEMDRGNPVAMEHHLGRLMANATKGAYMHQHESRVIGQQGEGRYLIDLGYHDEHGNRQAQIADTRTGELHPPMPKDSILARGYWDEPKAPVDVADILPLVNPQ